MKTPPIHRIQQGSITLIVIQDHSLPLLDFVLINQRGAGHDPEGQSGISHMYLDMLLRGTFTLSHQEYAMRVERLGSDLDTLMGLEACGFRGSCLSRHKDETFDLLAQAIESPTLNEQSFEQLKNEYTEQLRSDRDDDDSVADFFMNRSLYAGHTFERGTGGLYQDVKSIGYTDLLAYKDRHKEHDGIVFAIAGDITVEQAMPWATRFEHLLRPTKSPHKLSTPELGNHASYAVVYKPDRTQAQIRFGFLQDACMNQDGLAFWLGCVAFAGTFTAPFCQEIRDKRGWSYTASGNTRRMSTYPVPFTLRCAPQLSDLQACAELQWRLLEQFSQEGPSIESIDNARQYILGRYPFELVNGVDLLHPAIDLELLNKPIESMFQLLHRIKDLSAKHIQEVVQKRAHPQAAIMTLVAPKTAVESWIHDRKINVMSYLYNEGITTIDR